MPEMWCFWRLKGVPPYKLLGNPFVALILLCHSNEQFAYVRICIRFSTTKRFSPNNDVLFGCLFWLLRPDVNDFTNRKPIYRDHISYNAQGDCRLIPFYIL